MERKLKEAKENNFQVIIIGHIAPLERDGYIYKPRCYVAFLELLGSFFGSLPHPWRGCCLILFFYLQENTTNGSSLLISATRMRVGLLLGNLPC
jgi:hypothetical protein